MEQFLRKSQNSGEITWTRVKRSNGNYGYVRTKNGRPIDFDEYTGKFKMYDQPDTNSNWTEASKAGTSYGKIKSIEIRPGSHADYVAQQKLVDEHVKRVTPTAEDLFTIGTLGGLNNLSPTQWGRRVWDLGQAVQGNMSWDKFGNNWFYGNNGLVSDKYAQEHPYASTAINLVGDAGAFGTLSALRKLPKYAALMEAENRAAQEATALNWRDMLANSTRRTKLGDVEVDNPGLYYHQSDAASKTSNIVRTVENSGKIKLSLPTHTKAKPRQFVLEPQGNNKFYVHMRTWDGDHVPANLANGEKQQLFDALYSELPEGAEILFPKSGPGYYGTRGTVAGLQRLARDSRFTPGTKGILQYLDKDGTIKTYEGTSFIKLPRITAENATSITPEQWTAAQDAAIARGNMAEAQRLRDLHFKINTPNSVTHEIFHHGNIKPMDWYTFDPKRVGTTDEGYSGAGYYFAPTRPASQYAKEHLPHTLGPHGEQNAGLSGGKYHRYVYLNGKTKYKPLREHDWTTHTDFPFVDNRPVEVVVGDNRQIKLADAVTYDDNGVRIPLGERDNFNINDIRYGLLPFGIGLTGYGLYKRKQGGKMNTLQFLKNESGIHIKKKNRGKFTDYCGGQVTQECINRGKHSSNPAIRKRATFADNARRWKHKYGGFVTGVNVLDSNPRIYKYQTKIKVSPRGVVKKETGGSFVNNALNFINSDTGQSIIGRVSNIIQGMSAKKKLNKAIDAQKKAIDEQYNVAKNNIDMGAIKSQAQANLEQKMALSPGIHFGEIDLGYEENKLKQEAAAKATNDANAQRDQALANLNNQASQMSNEASNNIIGNIGGLLNGAFQLAGNYFSNKTSNNSTTVKPGYTYSKIASNNFSVPKTNFSVNMKL